MKTQIEGPLRSTAAATLEGDAAGTDLQGVRPVLPGPREVAARCALPLVMGLVILGTLLWGGFVTFVMALLLWKAAGAVL